MRQFKAKVTFDGGNGSTYVEGLVYTATNLTLSNAAERWAHEGKVEWVERSARICGVGTVSDTKGD